MECAGGHLRGPCTGPATLRCGSCGAVRYCSRHHQKAHWREHVEVCARMAAQMQQAPVVYDFPFSFAPHTTLMIENGDTSLCALIESWGIHGLGLWGAACDCFRVGATQGVGAKDGGWHLSASYCPCRAPENPSGRKLQSWEEYYDWRRIPFESPVALILHWPLTVYHALHLAHSQTILSSHGQGRALHIHYLGPERELDQLPVFAELLALLPSVQIHIDFVGPAVPESRDGENLTLTTYAHCLYAGCSCKSRNSSENGRLKIRLLRGFYHDRHSELGTTVPDLIFAANAGIAAFPSWSPTIQLIQSLKVPALFTDYCEEAAVMAVQSTHALLAPKKRDLDFPVQLNPFRQPLIPSNKILELPTLSNAFIFGVNQPFIDT